MMNDFSKIDETEIGKLATVTTEELDLINRGYSHMVDNGYSKLNGVTAILRSLAVRID
jgi:hypothetical protein